MSGGNDVYAGESLKEADAPAYDGTLITGASVLFGHNCINRRLLTLEPRHVKLKMTEPVSSTLTNNTDTRFAFKVLLPTYPHLYVHTLSGFLEPRQSTVLKFYHGNIRRKETFEAGPLPPVMVIGVEVSTRSDNVEDMFVAANGHTSLSAWTELLITVVGEPMVRPPSVPQQESVYEKEPKSL